MELPRLLAPCSPTNRVPTDFWTVAIPDTNIVPGLLVTASYRRTLGNLRTCCLP